MRLSADETGASQVDEVASGRRRRTSPARRRSSVRGAPPRRRRVRAQEEAQETLTSGRGSAELDTLDRHAHFAERGGTRAAVAVENFSTRRSHR
jgi:hypothetical protein